MAHHFVAGTPCASGLYDQRAGRGAEMSSSIQELRMRPLLPWPHHSKLPNESLRERLPRKHRTPAVQPGSPGKAAVISGSYSHANVAWYKKRTLALATTEPVAMLEHGFFAFHTFEAVWRARFLIKT